MSKIKDYKCLGDTFTGIDEEFAEKAGLILPDLYQNAEGLYKASVALKERDDNFFSVLPFDPALTAEAKGADIIYDTSNLGPRKKQDIIKDVDDLLKLREMDFTKGRMAETLKAVKLLKETGHNPAIEISGPFSIINGLMDLTDFMMSFRKKSDVIEEFMYKINKDLLNFFIKADEAGCDVIFYTDSSVGISLLGPKYMKQVLKWSTKPLLMEVDDKISKDCLVYLCPKLSFALTGADMIEWKKLELKRKMPYHNAMMKSLGEVRFSGNRCRKDEKRIANKSFPYFEFKEEI